MNEELDQSSIVSVHNIIKCTHQLSSIELIKGVSSEGIRFSVGQIYEIGS